MHQLFEHCLLETIFILLAKINKHFVKTDAYVSLIGCGVMALIEVVYFGCTLIICPSEIKRTDASMLGGIRVSML